LIFAPVAVGTMTTKGNTKNMPKKGKAVQVEHNLFDELWHLGSRKIPESVKISNVDAE